MMLFAAYLALIGALAIATSGPGRIANGAGHRGLFVVAFFTVPRFIFAQEPKQRPRPDLDRFLATGMRTFTGHCTGGAALVQMFIVPVALTIGMLAIAVVIALIRLERPAPTRTSCGRLLTCILVMTLAR